MQYQILDWDTDFFGMVVARITEPTLNEQELADILFELKAKNAALVYWPSNREFQKDAIKRLGGNLVDKKTTFVMDFGSLNFEEIISTDIVEFYTESMSHKEIEDLAIQSGEYSRFAVDRNIPRDKFVALYSIWINRSLRKEIAEEVLVIREGERVVGMVTLGNKNGRGDIGLIAVDKDHRAKKYGEKLVRAAQHWFVKNGYEFGQVVTQGMNLPACNLYKKCGYSVENEEYFYHFWPQQVA